MSFIPTASRKRQLVPKMDPQETVYEIKESEELGRYLVAKRNIRALEVIIQEKPLVCSPADDPAFNDVGRASTCLGCCARISFNPRTSACSKCRWPVCDVNCENINHHSENECKYFKSHGISKNVLTYPELVNETIFILRLLLFKRKDSAAWSSIVMKFEHHTEARKTKVDCIEKDKKIVVNLKNMLEASSGDAWFDLDEDEIIRISGVVNVNAFSSKKLEDECRSRRVRRRVTTCQCLFPTATLLAHQCVPNASWSVCGSPYFEQTIRATIDIPPGQMIAIAYAPQEVMWPTLQRMISTEEVAHFRCRCPRCQDPSELSTFIGAIKCKEGDCDHLSNSYLLPRDPLNPNSPWICSQGTHTQTVQQVLKLVDEVEKQFNSIKNSALEGDDEVEALEELYSYSSTDLHSNHFILLEISLRIVNRHAFSLHSMDRDDLYRFVQHCNRLLSVSDVLSPGYCRARAIVQFYLSQSLLVNVRREMCNYQQEQANGKKRTELKETCRRIQGAQRDAFLYFRTEDENDNKYKRVKGFNQYIACLVEEMDEVSKTLEKLCVDK